jgi:hypothetical protein
MFFTHNTQTVAVLRNKGITHFTPVQAQTYEHILAGRDMVARSRTGVYVGRKNSLQNNFQKYFKNCSFRPCVALRYRIYTVIVLCLLSKAISCACLCNANRIAVCDVLLYK